MIFKLRMVKDFCSQTEKEEYEKLGFKFEKEESEAIYSLWRVADEDPWRVADEDPVIEISTLEELLRLRESLGWSLMVGFDDGSCSITIVNDYL